VIDEPDDVPGEAVRPGVETGVVVVDPGAPALLVEEAPVVEDAPVVEEAPGISRATAAPTVAVVPAASRRTARDVRRTLRTAADRVVAS